MATVGIDKRRKPKVARELDGIIEKHGTLTPDAVVEEAQRKGTALHELFEKAGMFDAEKAAQFAQRTFAGRVIRQYRVWITVDDREPVRVRALVSLGPDRGKNGYRAMLDVLSDDERRDVMLTDAKKELSAFQRKYQVLSELEPVFAAIEAIE